MNSADWCRKNLPDLSGKRALVTGAASGLGLETTTVLAECGADVILADINEEGGRTAFEHIYVQSPKATAVFHALDLADLENIRSFSQQLNADGRPLDILVNNAGILPPLQRRTTKDGFEMKFGINVLGHYALTGLLMPSLIKSPAPRVVWVSSLVHRHAQLDFDDLNAERNYAPQRAYNQAKLACLVLALELQAKAQAAGAPLASIAAHPGVARTPLGDSRKGQPRRSITDHLTDIAFWIAMNIFSQPQDLGALPILKAAAAAGVKGGEFYGPDGIGEMRGSPKLVKPSKPALDPAVRQRLWAACEQLTAVRYDALRHL